MIIEKVKGELLEAKSSDQAISNQRSEITMLRQRLNKLNKQWEKKFTILRSSLHAIKVGG